MGDFVLTFAYLLTLMLAGFGVLRWILFREEEKLNAEFWLPVSFGLGLGVQTLCYLLMLAVFGSISPWVFWVAAALIFGSTMIPRAPVFPVEKFAGLSLMTPPAEKRYRSLYWAGVIVVFASATLLFENALRYPIASYDGRAIWNYKSKIIFQEKTVYTDAFLDPLRVHYHRDYPLMVPFAGYGLYEFLGETDENWLRFFFSSLMLMYLLYLYSAAASAGGKLIAVFATAVMAAMPFQAHWMGTEAIGPNSAEADIPLSFFSIIAIVSYLRWWKSGKLASLLLAGVFVSFALMTKKEGLVVFAVLAGANGLQLLFGRVEDRLDAFKKLLLANGITILFTIPWIIVSQPLPNYYNEDYVSMFHWETVEMIPGRLPVIAALYWEKITTVDNWSYMWILFWGTLLLRIPDWFRRRWFYLDAVVVIWMLGYLTVYLFSPLNLVFHLNTSLRRLLSHIFPVAVLQLVFYFAYLRDATRPEIKSGGEET